MHRLKCIINVDASSIITCGHFKKKRTGNCIAIIQYKANNSTIWSDPCLLSPQSQPGQKVNSFKKMNVEQCKSSQDRRWAMQVWTKAILKFQRKWFQYVAWGSNVRRWLGPQSSLMLCNCAYRPPINSDSDLWPIACPVTHKKNACRMTLALL